MRVIRIKLPRSAPALRLQADAALTLSLPALADENLFGYVRGSETLPEGAWELYQFATVRSDKGAGHYRATDYKTEIEYGLTNRLTLAGSINAMSLNTSGLTINGYLPGDNKFDLKLSGFSAEMKYNFLSPAKDDVGLSGTVELTHDTLDAHSGRKKDATKMEFGLQAQKYFNEGQVVLVGNGALEATYARRKAIADLPADFEWSTDPEMEVELKFGTGLSYRFAPGWYVGAEAQYETEFETEVGQERWSVFGGPTLHYAAKSWWATFTWFKQLKGGGEKYGVADAAVQAAFAAIERAQSLWSFHAQDSELTQLNRRPGERVALSPATLRLLRVARALMQASDGSFDCTVGGALVNHGMLPDHGGPEPLPYGEAQDIEIGPGWARLRRPVRLTLDGIAKGYAIDLAIGRMRRQRAAAGWVNAGGDLRAFGELALPVQRREADGSHTPLGQLRNAAMASSAVAADDARDPSFPGRIVTGHATPPAAGVWTVLARSAWRADALTKVAACTPGAQRAQTIARLGGCLIEARP